MLIKNEITNLACLPICRLDLTIGVGYDSDRGQIRSIRIEVTHNLSICLEELAPMVVLPGFGLSRGNVQFSVRIRRENYSAAMNGLADLILKRFCEEGIDRSDPDETLRFVSSEPPVLKSSLTAVSGSDLDR